MEGKECCACWSWIKRNLVWIVGLSLVLILWGGWLTIYWVAVFDDDTYRQIAGLFGDSFGAINALFSGIAMIGVAYTIWLQHSELSLLRSKMEEEKRDSILRAQPNIEFNSIPKPMGTTDTISFRIPLLNLRSLITDVSFRCETSGPEIRCGNSTVILAQDNWSDAISGEFKIPEIAEFNNSPMYTRFIEMRYRDGRGEKQSIRLLLTCTDTLRLSLAPNWTWDNPKPIV